MDQWLQILGALMVLAAFAAAQFHLLDPRSYLYLLLNMVGSATRFPPQVSSGGPPS